MCRIAYNKTYVSVVKNNVCREPVEGRLSEFAETVRFVSWPFFAFPVFIAAKEKKKKTTLGLFFWQFHEFLSKRSWRSASVSAAPIPHLKKKMPSTKIYQIETKQL